MIWRRPRINNVAEYKLSWMSTLIGCMKSKIQDANSGRILDIGVPFCRETRVGAENS
jgi:hypothetical protein